MKFLSAVILTIALWGSWIVPLVRSDGHTVEFPLGNKRPEGSHALTGEDVAAMELDADAEYMLVSEYFYGGVNLLDVTNGELTNVVPSAGYLERGALGVYYTNGSILVASGGPALSLPFEIYLYEASSGNLITTCTPDITEEEKGFMNDIELVGDIAYVTDTTHNRLWTFNVPTAVTSGSCEISYIELDEVFMGTEEAPFLSNGVVAFGDGFLISTYLTGALYYTEPSNNITEELVSPGTMVQADGLELVSEDDGSSSLYVTEGGDRVSVYKMEAGEEGPPTATLVGVLETDLFDSPATSAVLSDKIYVVNGRPGTVPFLSPGENDTATFNETFSIVGIDRMISDDDEVSTETEDTDTTSTDAEAPAPSPDDSGASPPSSDDAVADDSTSGASIASAGPMLSLPMLLFVYYVLW